MIHAAAAAAVASAVTAFVRAYRADLSNPLREHVLRFTPTRALETGVLVALAIGALMLASRSHRARVPLGRCRATTLRGLQTLGQVPTVIGLTAIVALAAGFRVLLVQAATEPRVLGDELVFSGIAKGFATHGGPLLRGELEIGHSVLYPLLLSPAYGLAADGASAYAAAKTINAIAISLAAVPSYMLARRLASRGWSFGVAALVAFEPWTAYASLTMTESLFLPVFSVFALTLVRMLERPTASRQLIVLAMLALVVGVRPQGLVLAGSVVVAIVLCGRLQGSLRRVARAYALVLGGLGLTLLVGVAAVSAGLPVPAGSSTALVRAYNPFQVVKWAVWNIAVYQLAFGVVALSAFPIAVRGLIRRSASAGEQAIGITAATLAAGLLLSVAVVSASPSGLGILHERSMFYATPLVLVCLAHWLSQGLPRPRSLTLVSAVVAVGMVAALPTGVVLRTNNVDSPTAAWLASLHGSTASIPLQVWTVGVAAAAGAILLLARSALAPVVALVLAFSAGVGGLDYSGPFSRAQMDRLAWVDHALPAGASATIVHLGLTRPDQPCAEATGYEQQGLVVWTEFFNTRVDRVMHIDERVERDNLDSPRLTVESGGVVHRYGRPFETGFAILDSRQPVVGRQLARLDLGSLDSQYQEGASLSLWAVEPPLRFLAHAQPLPPRANGGEC